LGLNFAPYLSPHILKTMKNILFIALLGSASALIAAPTIAVAAPAQTAPAADQAPSHKELKKIRKARQKTGPEVYKGTVAEQRRIVTDAPGAEKEDGDDTSSKKERKSKKN
jgi:Skp family chaperone for outer membrane proteins